MCDVGGSHKWHAVCHLHGPCILVYLLWHTLDCNVPVGSPLICHPKEDSLFGGCVNGLPFHSPFFVSWKPIFQSQDVEM